LLSDGLADRADDFAEGSMGINCKTIAVADGLTLRGICLGCGVSDRTVASAVAVATAVTTPCVAAGYFFSGDI
jgi:hypothetical protein